jgi:SAM-dependent methyltransferase
MNTDHAALCSSREWARHLADEVLPEALAGVPLGGEVLEIGPGYGASTDELVRMAGHLTLVEADKELAADLAARFPAVTVVHGDGAALPFEDRRFGAVVCFTMLHHVPSTVLQDALFAEAHRILTPGGVFAGSDSVGSAGLRDFHRGDTYVPVDPATLPRRLRAAGFVDVDVAVTADGHRLTFAARTPARSSK